MTFRGRRRTIGDEPWAAGWFSLGLAAAAGAARCRPSLPLRPSAVAVATDSDAVLDHLRTSLTCGEDVLARTESGVIRRFQGRAGSFRYTTVELVDVGAGSVTFEHLRGPFLACAETIEVQPTAHGCRLVHSGRFSMRGGFAGWLFGLLLVRTAFEKHVREHLLQTQQELTTGRR